MVAQDFHLAKLYLYTDGNCNGTINTNELIRFC